MTNLDQPISNKPKPEPVFLIPGVVMTFLIAILVIHAIVSYLLTAQQRFDVIINFGFIPVRFSEFTEPGSFETWSLLTPLSYSLLHADWTHVLVNSVWMLAFGSVLAKRIGVIAFLLFCVFGSVAGAVAHYLADATSPIPMIGASAIVSACMGSAVRFAFPRGGRFSAQAHNEPIQALSECITNKSAVAFVSVWFVINLVFGLGGEFVVGEGNAIAWQAHLGGFLFGLLCLAPFDRRSASHG